MWIRNGLGFVCQLFPMKVKICLGTVLDHLKSLVGLKKFHVSGLAVGAGELYKLLL